MSVVIFGFLPKILGGGGELWIMVFLKINASWLLHNHKCWEDSNSISCWKKFKLSAFSGGGDAKTLCTALVLVWCGYTPTSSSVTRRIGAFSLVYVLPLNYLSEWSPMERRAPAQWFVTRPVSLRSLKTGTTQIPFLLVLYVFIASVCSTAVSLVYTSVHYRVIHNTFVCRGAPRSRQGNSNTGRTTILRLGSS